MRLDWWGVFGCSTNPHSIQSKRMLACMGRFRKRVLAI